MQSRRHIVVGSKLIVRCLLLISIAFTAVGCLTAQKPASQSNLPPPVTAPTMAAPSTTRPDGMDASTISPAELVAERAQQYSQEMAPAIARREASAGMPQGTPQQSPPVATSAPVQPSPVQPSLVQWGDTSDTQLSLLPGYLLRTESPQPPAAVDASASAANESASESTGQLASMKTLPAQNNIRDLSPSRAPAQLASNITSPGNSVAMQVNAPDGQSVGEADGAPPGETLSGLSARLSRRVQDYPHDVSAQFDDELMQFLMDQPVPNLSTISSLPDEDREMISAVMDGLSNYRNNLRSDNNMLLSRKVRPLLEMADRLRSLADLTIPTLALCQEVRGFGNYTPFDGDPPHFTAGTAHPVILYCEVQNFSSQLNDNKMWETDLVQDAVLYTEGGMSVWTDKTRTVNDTARARRQDFFIVQRIDLPSELPMGRYLLKVSIEDKQSHHVAESTQPLEITAN